MYSYIINSQNSQKEVIMVTQLTNLDEVARPEPETSISTDAQLEAILGLNFQKLETYIHMPSDDVQPDYDEENTEYVDCVESIQAILNSNRLSPLNQSLYKAKLVEAVLKDLMLLNPAQVISEGIVDRVKKSYDVAASAEGELFGEVLAQFSAGFTQIMDDADSVLYCGALRSAEAHDNRFPDAWKNYEVFFNQFMKRLGETEKDLIETNESLNRIYGGQNE
jgi:hypothetical protein